jgi:hypothetical protein
MRLERELELLDENSEQQLTELMQRDVPKPKEVVSAADIFALLKELHELRGRRGRASNLADDDVGGDTENRLSQADFRETFTSLELGLTDGQIDRLLAVINLNGDKWITVEEFEGGWSLIEQEILDENLNKFGLDDSQVRAAPLRCHQARRTCAPRVALGISLTGRCAHSPNPLQVIFVVLSVVLALITLMVFLLTLLSCYLNEGQFGAVVQSLLVALAGKAVTTFRDGYRSKAEEGEVGVGELVHDLMEEVDDAVTQD